MASYGAMPVMYGNSPVPMAQGQQPPTGWRGLLQNQDLAMALLANSGYSPQKRSLGEILGTSMMQAQGMKSQREDDAFKRQYMQAQIQQMQRGANASPFGAVQPDKFTPESIARFEQTGKHSDLKLRNIGVQYGRYNPGDFTPESWAGFVESGDPSGLVRYVAPSNPTVENVGGAPTIVQPSRVGGAPRITPISTLDAEAAAAARIAQDKAVATATGEAQGALAGKAPAKASFNIALGNLRQSIGKAMQGMVAGPAGSVFDYGDKKLFNSRVQQLSTDLRTVYRIPGEGTLSDQEQRQYGFQLPSTDNPPDVNEQILNDLEARTNARTDTPIGAPKPKAMPKVGEVRGGYRFKGGDPAKKENWEKQ